MGRSKTRRKQQRNQAADDQDPDVSETEPSSSENASTSITDATVLSNSNVMDTDIEDSEQTTGNSTPADESAPSAAGGVADTDPDGITSEDNAFTMKASDGGNNGALSPDITSAEHTAETSHLNQWLDQQQQPEEEKPASLTACSHAKVSCSMPGIRKALKSGELSTCSKRPCSSAANLDKEIDAEESSSLSKELWICLQCGNVGCGDHHAGGGDAEAHFKTPRSDQHNIVLKLEGDAKTCWCYKCQSLIDAEKNTSTKEVVSFLKKSHQVKALQAKTKTASPPIALGPPPAPPQPESSTTVQSESSKSYHHGHHGRNRMNNSRNKITPYSCHWDNSNRDEWPLGLENLGNTCFMNSALQCLSRTKSLIPKLDLYGTGNTLEIMVTAEPPSVDVLGTISPETNGDTASALFNLGTASDGGFAEENGESNHTVPSNTEIEAGGSSPSSSDMDSLLDVASGTSSKSSPSKELAPEAYKADIEKELKKCLRLKLVIPKDSMTSRVRHAFKTMTRSADVQPANSSQSSSEYFGRGRHVFTPSAIHNAMARHFRPGQQHDSHELLRTVVDMMKKDQIKAFRLAIMQCYGIKKTEGKNCDPKIAELLKMWDRKLYHKTFVDEIFGGELVTFSKCLTCGNVRRSHEDFLDISLSIRVYTRNQVPRRPYSVFDDDGDSHRSLEDCLKSFTEPEQLAGSNAVECENCHRANLAKLEAGASFEEIFPGIKPPVTTEVKKQTCEPEPEPEPVLETEMDSLQHPLLPEEQTPQTYENLDNTDMDDLDEPAVDGIIGNTSDMEDEGNGVPPVFLLDETEDKEVATNEFLSSNKDNMSLSLAATQDEGFSESDSSEEKKSASISASSSRNSISEAENGTSTQKHKENEKPIPITKCPCSRHQMVSRPPECLTVHLKRFQITSHGTSKLSDRITFPYILNLTPFCAREDEDLQRLDGKDVYDEDGEVKYALYGIVEHSGSLHWGHYVAYIKVPGNDPTPIEEEKKEEENATASSSSNSNNKEEVTPEKWFYISDSSVSPSSLDSVLGMDPYILFYERIRGKDKKDKLSQLDRLNNQSSTSAVSAPAYEEVAATAVPETTTTAPTTSTVAGCSFDFNTTSYTFD